MTAGQNRQPYRRVGKNGTAFYGSRRPQSIAVNSVRSSEATSQDEKIESVRLANSIDERMGFGRFESGKKRVGWLCNMHSTTIWDTKGSIGRAGVDFYFIQDDGNTFKATLEYDPYFLLAIKRGKEAEVEEWCKRAFEGTIKGIKKIEKEDLQMPNHLLGYRRTLLKITFANVSDLLTMRKAVMPIAERNKKKMNALDTYAEVASANAGFDIFDDDQEPQKVEAGTLDASDHIVDIREYDVPYHVRVAIDKDIRIGRWYTVEAKHGQIELSCVEERLQRADPVVMAFDIETTKLPLKFPDASFDQIMMISYMIDGQGFLITNREIISQDIQDFDYTPKPEFEGPFVIFNEPDERSLIERFFTHIKEARPTVISTYNGDFFDWPFVETRASIAGIDMYREIGFRKNAEDIYQSDYCAHMDAFCWVNRDSYLPQGSRGLKAVTVAKLGYDPDELDPELMTPYASERPQTLAEYSVSDAVATYYLYMKYVHPFIFSLCTIIPLGPDDVLRKGTGTLCEMLLMVQAYQKNILLPNKHQAPKEAFWDGHLLESETYVGGHVESIEAGVFRSDIPCSFALDTAAIDELLRDLDSALTFSITVEEKKEMHDIVNYEQIRNEIASKLSKLKDEPTRTERPSIYHLDVASMYPNIMTTNRLQPDSMITESDCAACDFNRPGKTCDRRLPWSWRGEFLPAKRDEYNMIRHALENETFPGRNNVSNIRRTFHELSLDEQTGMVKKRLQEYSKKIYHKIHDARTLEREAIICQRENPFYVNTVRDFRDRRYDFKGKQKIWKNKADALKAACATAAEIEEAKKMIILFDSLQLAHKVILNSFYGYVMRKGSRWYSMEMAGVTCLTGAHIIQMARQLVERIGRPLELDTDGIWCILPASFPENFSFQLQNGKKLTISYPCVMLNHLVHARFTNHQYQTLKDPNGFRYETHSDNSIFFEVDGPYKAMILPTSKEEDKNLKKRYAVFNHDGSLAELKGFEVKRRGELKLIKIFQTQIFKFFLDGSTLAECYASVAKVADQWLDVLHSRGITLADEELIDLICENKSMTKTLEEYGSQKSTAITTAKRLAEFLGEQMIKDKGLNCKYVISSRPRNAPVTERAIPVAIFAAEEQVKRFFLRKWLRDDPGDMDPRTVIDWAYYLERLGSVIQKLITIPAALQKIRNPVPRVAHPEWLERRVRQKDDVFKQKKMTDMFESKRMLADVDPNTVAMRVGDLEDFGSNTKKAVKVLETYTKPSYKRKEADTSVPVQELFAAPVTIAPSINEDYEAWLKYQKKKWKLQKQARIRRRHLFGEKAPDASDAIGSFFRNQAELLYTSNWQVLQLIETETPGHVRAFILIERKIHTIQIVVPRTLFLNVKAEDLPHVQEIHGCKVEKVVGYTLPNGHPSAHLFKMTMPEEVFKSEQKKLSLLFNHPGVEGVYETQVPLDLRAVLELGNICTFDEKQKGVLGKGLEQGFDLSSLKRVAAKASYLDDVQMGYIYLYHIVQPGDRLGDKEYFAVLSPSSGRGHIIVLNRSKDDQAWPNIDRLYEERLSNRLKENGGEPWQSLVSYQPSIQFSRVQVSSRRKALLQLSDVVKRTRGEEKDRPMMLVFQSPDHRILPYEVSSLRELPIIPLEADAMNGKRLGLNPHRQICEHIIHHYLNFPVSLGQRMELARYGNIPVGNIESNDPRHVIDVFYARRLQQEKVVLWWSNGPQPDHAGYEKDNVFGLLETTDMPAVNHAGTYSSVCIDLSVRNLAINTILASSLLNEAEGSDSFSFNPAAPGEGSEDDGGAHVIYSDKAFAAAGITVLREMVKSWWAESASNVEMADVMVQHLVRWVAEPSSHLYDRALHYYVQTMSKKALQQLMTDFRRVGSHIVYASPHRLLLQTSKAEVGNAYAYSEYILKTVKAKPLFSFLELNITEYWDFLAWSDAHNYGGKASDRVVDADSQQLETVMCWQLESFLPEVLRKTFHDRIVDFIELMHQRKRPSSEISEDGPRATQLPVRQLTDDSSVPTQFLPKSTFTKPLLKEVQRLIGRFAVHGNHELLSSDWDFPSLAGGQVKDTHPVLQLIKSIVHVISLDRSIGLEARLLRRDLLMLCDVKEFAAEASWNNPSASYKLVDFVCQDCCAIRDLDLCKDHDLAPAVAGGQDNDGPGTRGWTCTQCGAGIKKNWIEERLIAEAQSMSVRWTTQDLQCGKCKKLRVNDFMEHCACAGEWQETVDRRELLARIDVLTSIGNAYDFNILGSVLGQIRNGIA